MRKRLNAQARRLNSFLALVLMAFAVVACSSLVKDYTPREFDSDTWRSGNKTVRGTMYADLFEKATLTNKSKEEVEQLLGEPDKKMLVEGREVWLYRLDVRGEWTSPCFPVSFEPTGRSFAGRVKAGTMSMIVEEKS